ncbi:hypothetical protein DNL40_06105 [Xylanimonas oleitrophica]|uniref:Phosphoesterase PA-phosphatase n=1 Tax=Xylanimonas oleitrophica TaxID=2607479 RepID=A0A2W5YG91_9MICO|nr:hypothetical protein DNL40_06105 [Xylanimonas oleitrophica]
MLGPAVTVPAVVLGIAVYAAPPGPARWGWVAVTVGLVAGAPVALVVALARAGVLESIDARPRRQRLWTLAALVAIEVAAVSVLALLGAPPLLFGLVASCVVGVVVMALVTPVVRASIHVAALAVPAGAFVHVAWPVSVALLAAAAVVGVARLTVRDHTPLEVTVGMVAGATTGLAAAAVLLPS